MQTFGGEAFNTLLAALFTRLAPKRRFAPTPERVVGPVLALDLSLDDIRGLADATQAAGDLPLSAAGKFANPSFSPANYRRKWQLRRSVPPSHGLRSAVG